MEAPGRCQRPAWHYGPEAIASAPARSADCLYVIGGLYGNEQALAAIFALAAGEKTPPRLVFNGDFNWFNKDPESFRRINEAVLAHDACLGNVEAELCGPDADFGCGCAYPLTVDDGTVRRSNEIHAELKATAAAFPDIVSRLRRLPMFLRYEIGGTRVAVTHGDSRSLAGWGFAQDELRRDGADAWLAEQFRLADAEIFACTHTCLPALRCLPGPDGKPARCVMNNGAAGMPNFRDPLCGLISRIGLTPSPHAGLFGARAGSLHVDALPVFWEKEAFARAFLAAWPEGTPAHVSYWDRISRGTDCGLSQALL